MFENRTFLSTKVLFVLADLFWTVLSAAAVSCFQVGSPCLHVMGALCLSLSIIVRCVRLTAVFVIVTFDSFVDASRAFLAHFLGSNFYSGRMTSAGFRLRVFVCVGNCSDSSMFTSRSAALAFLRFCLGLSLPDSIVEHSQQSLDFG